MSAASMSPSKSTLYPGERHGHRRVEATSVLTDQVLDDPQHAYSQLLVSSVLQV